MISYPSAIAEGMETALTQWDWQDEAKKLGYTLAAEERERSYEPPKIRFSAREISAED